MSYGAIEILTDGTARLEVGDYLLTLTPSDRRDPWEPQRDTSEFTLHTSESLLVYSGEGPTSGVQGFENMGDALASLCSFLSAEAERLAYGSADSDGPIFPDATPGLVEFLEQHSDDVSIAQAEWEECPF